MTSLVAEGAARSVLDVLTAQGMPIKSKLDIEVPDFPTDITAVDDTELMSLATKYMANYNFMLTQVALAEIGLTEVENMYSMAEAKALLTKTNGKSTEKAVLLKAAVLTDPELQALASSKMYAYSYHKMLKTLLENLERSYQLVSRELTRRTSAMKNRF